jgi:hypothetical protein
MLKVWTENDAQYVSGNKDIGEREEMERGESVMRLECGETYGREIGEKERLV